MPLFEYICRTCRQQFETLVTASRPASCPTCQGTALEKQHSVFAVASRSSAGPALPAGGPCGACGDPRGPGSCRVD